MVSSFNNPLTSLNDIYQSEYGQSYQESFLAQPSQEGVLQQHVQSYPERSYQISFQDQPYSRSTNEKLNFQEGLGRSFTPSRGYESFNMEKEPCLPDNRTRQEDSDIIPSRIRPCEKFRQGSKPENTSRYQNSHDPIWQPESSLFLQGQQQQNEPGQIQSSRVKHEGPTSNQFEKLKMVAKRNPRSGGGGYSSSGFMDYRQLE